MVQFILGRVVNYQVKQLWTRSKKGCNIGFHTIPTNISKNSVVSLVTDVMKYNLVFNEQDQYEPNTSLHIRCWPHTIQSNRTADEQILIRFTYFYFSPRSMTKDWNLQYQTLSHWYKNASHNNKSYKPNPFLSYHYSISLDWLYREPLELERENARGCYQTWTAIWVRTWKTSRLRLRLLVGLKG